MIWCHRLTAIFGWIGHLSIDSINSIHSQKEIYMDVNPSIHFLDLARHTYNELH